MNTESRLTRSRARTTGTPLVKPFGTEIRPRSSRRAKDVGTPLPRAALFDRTNEPSEVEKEITDHDAGYETFQTDSAKPVSTNPEGTVLASNKDAEASVTEIPFEDNIVKQLLEEYTSIEENVESEMHITPLRTQPVPPAGNKPAAAEPETAPPQTAQIKKLEQTIHEEMLITPQRTDTPTGQVPSDVTADSTPVPEAEPKNVEPAMPAAETKIDAAHESDTQKAGKEADASKAVLTLKNEDRWEMDGSPYVSQKFPLATAPAARPTQHVIKSEIKPTTPFDPRSLCQMKEELKAASGKTKVLASLPSDSAASESTMYTGAVCATEAEESEEASSELCKALDTLLIAPKVAPKEPLRGVPVAAGRHTRFTEEGEAVESPSADRTLLRGFPAPAGSHLRFDD